MKAPDKIYIQTNAGEAFSSKWTTIPFRDFENTEYIRKDALLEWLKKEMKEWLSEFNMAQGVKMGLTLALDKIESL